MTYRPNINSNTFTNGVKQHRILIADDEGAVSNKMKSSLESEGFKVDVIDSSIDVFNHDYTPYCLYIVDMTMGDMLGHNLAIKLKQDTTTSYTPLIFCSNRDNGDAVINGLSLGADDYLLKPFSMNEMVARVKSILRRYRIASSC